MVIDRNDIKKGKRAVLEKMMDRKNILVIGDAMIDIYYIGDVTRISPEAPVPVLKKKKKRISLGGAANVAANLAAAGQIVSLMTICGNDENGNFLLQELEYKRIGTDFIKRTEKATTTKIRFIANGSQQIMRMDIEEAAEIGREECTCFLNTLQEIIDNYDLILISDYLKGLITYEFSQGIIQTANKNKIPVIVDVKGNSAKKYRGAYLLKPNKRELEDLTGLKVQGRAEIVKASRKLLTDCDCCYVLTTCGSEGMILVDKSDFYVEHSMAKEVYDVTGAGDTVISYLAVCLANNMDIKVGVSISNKAAGIQVAKLGTSTVSLEEIEKLEHEGDNSSKLLEKSKIPEIKEKYRNKRIVFTNGCFDILHSGHVEYLQQASQLGDILIVGLNSDKSVKRLKGITRPVNIQKERAEILCALACVDYVVIFEEDTPYELIKEVQPDVLVKGGDYKIEDIVGKDIVEKIGGIVKVLPYIEGKSTTNLLRQMEESEKA